MLWRGLLTPPPVRPQVSRGWWRPAVRAGGTVRRPCHNRGLRRGARMLSYVSAVWRCRYFWLSLVKMDLRTRYRRSVLGMGWSLLHPIAMTIVLCVVFQTAFAAGGGIRQYAPY